jgi:cytochrome c oxidase subunit 2
VTCHTIRGTDAGSHVGPELTHVGSRLTIAAGTLPNTRGHLSGWIADPQSIKPGARMPPNGLAPEDLQAVLTYVRSLR